MHQFNKTMGGEKKVSWSPQIAETAFVELIDETLLPSLFYQREDVNDFEADLIQEEARNMIKEGYSAYNEMIGFVLDRWAANESSAPCWIATDGTDSGSLFSSVSPPNQKTKSDVMKCPQRKVSMEIPLNIIFPDYSSPNTISVSASSVSTEEKDSNMGISSSSSSSIPSLKRSQRASADFPLRSILNNPLFLSNIVVKHQPDFSSKEKNLLKQEQKQGSEQVEQQKQLQSFHDALLLNSKRKDSILDTIFETESDNAQHPLAKNYDSNPTRKEYTSTCQKTLSTTIEIPVSIISPSLHKLRISVEGPELAFLQEKRQLRQNNGTDAIASCVNTGNKLNRIDELIEVDNHALMINDLVPQSKTLMHNDDENALNNSKNYAQPPFPKENQSNEVPAVEMSAGSQMKTKNKTDKPPLSPKRCPSVEI